MCRWSEAVDTWRGSIIQPTTPSTRRDFVLIIGLEAMKAGKEIHEENCHFIVK